MSQASDFWYIRFPDGRILRAASTTIVRQEVSAGRIPLNSTVRRSPTEEWVPLEWMQEFADLVERRQAVASQPLATAAAHRHSNRTPPPPNKPGVAARLDSSRLHLVGLRGYFQELLAALDSTLVARKLLAAGLAGLLLGVLLAAWNSPLLDRSGPWTPLAWCLGGLLLLVFAFTAVLLTQLTYIELSRLRPARWSEGLADIARLTIRLIIALALVGGIAWGLIVLLRWLPVWLLPGEGARGIAFREAAAAAALSVGMVLEVCLWPVLLFAWLLAPILVVEGCSLGRGLRDWLALLRRHLGRVFLYEVLAVGLGLLMSAPFLLLLLPLFGWYVDGRLLLPAAWTRAVLLGLAVSPLLAYLIVANVFIYLNLRYSASSQ